MILIAIRINSFELSIRQPQSNLKKSIHSQQLKRIYLRHLNSHWLRWKHNCKSSVSQGVLSLSLVRLQIVGGLIQIMRFIDIRWPPNVADYYSTSHIDPTSIMLPIDFITEWNDPWADRNYSLPRVFEEYETPLFFSDNYSNEMSNLMLWISIIGSSVLLFHLLKRFLKKMTNKLELPKTNARKKLLDNYIPLIHKLNQQMNRTDDSILWNFLLMLFSRATSQATYGLSLICAAHRH